MQHDPHRHPKPPKPASLAPLLPFVRCAIPFTSTAGQAFLRLPEGDGHLALPVRSRDFRDWFFRAFFAQYQSLPSAHAWHALLHHLEAAASAEPQNLRLQVGRRVASLGAYIPEKIFLDLANLQREYVEISPDGWKIGQDEAILLETSRNMLPHFTPAPSPDPAADLELLHSCLNLPRPAWLRALVWLLSAFRPRGPYPILVLQGPPGSGKSFAATVLRTLVDPSTSPLTPIPAGPRDLLALARCNQVLAFDHISAFSPQLAAALCRLSTSLGFAFRERGETEALQESYSRPVILTVTDRWSPPSDLASRAFTATLPAIPPAAFRTEADLLTAIHSAWPRILGAICSALSAALAGATPQTRSPGRHAAALDWAIPAASVLGVPADEIRAAFAHPPPLHPLVDAIGKLLLQRRHWTGSASELLALLQPALDCETPKGVSQQLNNCALILADAGIELKFKRLHGRRIIRLEGDASCENPSQDASPKIEASSQPAPDEELTAA